MPWQEHGSGYTKKGAVPGKGGFIKDPGQYEAVKRATGSKRIAAAVSNTPHQVHRKSVLAKASVYSAGSQGAIAQEHANERERSRSHAVASLAAANLVGTSAWLGHQQLKHSALPKGVTTLKRDKQLYNIKRAGLAGTSAALGAAAAYAGAARHHHKEAAAAARNVENLKQNPQPLFHVGQVGKRNAFGIDEELVQAYQAPVEIEKLANPLEWLSTSEHAAAKGFRAVRRARPQDMPGQFYRGIKAGVGGFGAGGLGRAGGWGHAVGQGGMRAGSWVKANPYKSAAIGGGAAATGGTAYLVGRNNQPNYAYAKGLSRPFEPGSLPEQAVPAGARDAGSKHGRDYAREMQRRDAREKAYRKRATAKPPMIGVAKAYQPGTITLHDEQAQMHARKKMSGRTQASVGVTAAGVGGTAHFLSKDPNVRAQMHNVARHAPFGQGRRAFQALEHAPKAVVAGGLGLAGVGATRSVYHGHKQNRETKAAQEARRSRNGSVAKAFDSERARHRRRTLYQGGATIGSGAAATGAGVLLHQARGRAAEAGLARRKEASAQQALRQSLRGAGPRVVVKPTGKNKTVPMKRAETYRASSERFQSQVQSAASHASRAEKEGKEAARLGGQVRRLRLGAGGAGLASAGLAAAAYGIHQHGQGKGRSYTPYSYR